MATLRQTILSEMACAMALSPDKYRPVLVQTIETWFINGWANDKEMAYWKGLSHNGQLRFIRDCHLMMEFKVREWEETDAAIAKWQEEYDREAALASAALGPVHSFEAETVDEIIAAEILEDQIKMSSSFSSKDGKTRFITMQLDDEEVIWLAVAFDITSQNWIPKDGTCYYLSCHCGSTFVRERFPEFEAPTFERAIANVLRWLNAVMAEPDTV